MGIDNRIVTESGTVAGQSCRGTNTGKTGMIVKTETLVELDIGVLPFLNDTFGAAMNQNVTFSGTPELIHDGQPTGVWAPTANSGTWNFADAGKVTITGANNNDSATFDDAGTTDMSTHTAITGLVDLDVYNENNNGIFIQFGLAGIPLGNAVNLNNLIDTGNFSEQAFVIPKEALGIATLTVDEMTITLTRTGGAKPTVKFDDIQIEETGTPLSFKVQAPGRIFHINNFRFSFVDAFTGISTVAGATENATLPQLSYNQLLALPALTNGITLTRVHRGVVTFSQSLRQLSHFLRQGAAIVNLFSDATNTYLDLDAVFPDQPIIDGSKSDSENFIALTIADDLSGLIEFTAIARGSFEV